MPFPIAVDVVDIIIIDGGSNAFLLLSMLFLFWFSFHVYIVLLLLLFVVYHHLVWVTVQKLY